MPVIASGGAGELEHLPRAIEAGADAVLCASIFHYGQHTVAEAKERLARAGVPVETDSGSRRSKRRAERSGPIWADSVYVEQSARGWTR